MDQHAKNKLKMYKAVETICTAQQADWNTTPAFVNAFTLFSTKLQQLEQASYNQVVATPGVTENKKHVLDTTIERANIVANALRALAAASGDVLMKNKLDFSKSDFLRGGGQYTLQQVDLILNYANDHIAALDDFGIKQAHIDELTSLRQQLGVVIGSPREAIINRRNETLQIRQSIDEIDNLLRDHLDPLTEVLKTGSPAFYKRFKAARVIVDHKGKKNGPAGDPDLGGNPGSELPKP
jgi:hypothetical protein